MTITESLNDSVPGEVRAHMARKAITQKQLAGTLGWTQVYLSRRLTGRVGFSLSELDQIAAALGIPSAELVAPAA